MGDYVEPLSRWKQRKIDAVMSVAPRLIAQRYRPDCCIAATRILQTVFRSLKSACRPLSVVTAVYNGPYMDWQALHGKYDPTTAEEVAQVQQSGGWSVVLGLDEPPRAPDRWPGHLVLLAWECVIFDVALWQASRPHKGINLVPLVIQVPAGFVLGQETRACTVNGCDIHYEARPEDRSYEGARDWWDARRHFPVCAEILYEARRKLV
jgi:hypothetical protein